ncbi:gamma-butyrobetaine dioxygenase-like [Lytechinus pictus]|uniref:gamma-butyrobetaine dioxygenase-like n=1 Tax=Lytechinus pictus TaxID=7653 RepID=UPI0030BA08AA
MMAASTSAYHTEASTFAQSEWESNNNLSQAYLNHEDGLVIVNWELSEGTVDNKRRKTSGTSSLNGTTKAASTSYPFIWLRDFCHCEQCFDEASVTKKTNLQDLDLEIGIKQISVSEDGKQIMITWRDDHESVYPSSWLWCSRFHDSAPDPFMDLAPELWRADGIPGRLRVFQFDELLTSNQALYDWMKEIKVLGLVLVKNAPEHKEALSQLGKRVGYLKATNFGEVSSVYAPTDPKNPIYTAGNLYFHTDLTYYHQPPGIELLHCIKQFEGVGGDSTLVDGFNAARQMKEVDPEAFNVLSSYDVEFYQTGLMGPGRYFQIARNKIIRLDDDGEPIQISYSNHSRTSILRMPPKEVALFYRAMKLFTDLLYHENNMYTYKMEAGDIIVINNFRVLHGRKGFEMKKGSERYLATAYLDWDLVYSRMRVLHRQLDI